MVRDIDYTSEIYVSRATEVNMGDSKDTTIEECIRDLKDTLQAHEERVFLCANEIGYDKRIACVRFSDKVMVFVNPLVQKAEDMKLSREHDYATDKDYIIPRNNGLTIAYQSSKGEIQATKMNEETSMVFSQAMDCLNGLHTSDYGLEVLPEFDAATDEERAEVIKEYLESLNSLRDQFDKELQADETFRDEWNGYRYLKAKEEGLVETEKIEPEAPPMNRRQRRMMDRITKRLNRRH